MISSIAFGIFGLAVLISVAFTFSRHKKSIDWKQVAAGIGLQVVFAIIVIMVAWTKRSTFIPKKITPFGPVSIDDPLRRAGSVRIWWSGGLMRRHSPSVTACTYLI